jgi:hypothetical protein
MYIFTHHKCASSWLTVFLERVCELNGLSFSRTHISNTMPNSADIVLFTNASYQFLSHKVTDGVHVIRNPFDLLVSAYYSHKTTHSIEGWPKLAAQRRLLETLPYDVGVLLTVAFIERSDFYDVALGPFAGLREWDFDDPRFETLRMEDLVKNVNGILGLRLIREFGDRLILPTSGEFQFEQFAGGRTPGRTDPLSHYRSGEVGEWRKVLPEAAGEYVKTHFAELLAKHYPEYLAVTR